MMNLGTYTFLSSSTWLGAHFEAADTFQKACECHVSHLLALLREHAHQASIT